jgi:hypothetical protein
MPAWAFHDRMKMSISWGDWNRAFLRVGDFSLGSQPVLESPSRRGKPGIESVESEDGSR